ncbi:hypothetical protein V6Z12_A08G156700 [Gossypium hirsutum]
MLLVDGFLNRIKEHCLHYFWPQSLLLIDKISHHMLHQNLSSRTGQTQQKILY